MIDNIAKQEDFIERKHLHIFNKKSIDHLQTEGKNSYPNVDLRPMKFRFNVPCSNDCVNWADAGMHKFTCYTLVGAFYEMRLKTYHLTMDFTCS